MFVIVLAAIAFFNISAQEANSRFSADTYVRKTTEDKVFLDGNVNIVKGKEVLKADKVELNTKTNVFTATGNVDYKSPGMKITGESIQGNLDSPEGFISNGKIVNGVDIFEGRKIERLNKKHFILKEGRYTSCVNCPPDWRLYGNNIDLTSGEYAHMEDVVVEGFGLPLFYTPYLVLPVKSERQSGFLMPTLGFGSDGFNIHESYFWAISRSYDMTYTLGNYNNRGLEEGVEFRSAYTPESFTNMYYFHINDKKFANILVDDEPLKRKNRNGFRLGQEFKLVENTYAKMNVLYASDQNIPRDFPDEMPGRAEPALESKFLLTTHSTNISYNATASYYENLLSKNPLDNNRAQLQRLPELSVNVPKIKFSEFMFESDMSYLNVYRPSSPYDDMNSDQAFNNGDLIRTGQRFDIFPRISMPLSNRFVKFTPQIGGRYDYYVLPDNPGAKRAYAEAGAKLSTEISATYQRGPDKQYRAIKHVIEPFVEYDNIPVLKQSNSPFFNAQSGDIKAPMFDSIDKIGRTNIITYGINNRLLTKYIKNFIATPIAPTQETKACENCPNSNDIITDSTQDFLGLRRTSNNKEAKKVEFLADEEFSVLQPFQWKVYQSYNLLDKTGKPFGYLYSDMLSSYEWMSLLLSNFYNIYTKKMGMNSRLRFFEANSQSIQKKYIEIGYYNNKTDPNVNIDQLRLLFGFAFWRFGTNVMFTLNNTIKGKFSDKLQDKYFDVTYQPPANCWFLKFAVDAPYDKPGINTTITFNLIISGQAVGFGAGQGLFGKTIDNVTAVR